MAVNLFSLSVVLSLLSGLTGGFSQNQNLANIPPTCKRIECPAFDSIHVGKGFEIRRYNSSMWVSTAPIQDISLVSATRSGFSQLFNYIQGKNKYNQTINMTAPVLSEVSPSDGPLCQSSFVVSFYVPKVNQANPPPAEGLHVQKWGTKYVAVRQFTGFVQDSNIGVEAAALHTSLVNAGWSQVVDKGKSSDKTPYLVAQYNSPFEFLNRVNEIWITFDMKADSVI